MSLSCFSCSRINKTRSQNSLDAIELANDSNDSSMVRTAWRAGSKSKDKTIIIRVGWTYGIGITEINTFSYSGEDDGD